MGARFAEFAKLLADPLLNNYRCHCFCFALRSIAIATGTVGVMTAEFVQRPSDGKQRAGQRDTINSLSLCDAGLDHGLHGSIQGTRHHKASCAKQDALPTHGMTVAG